MKSKIFQNQIKINHSSLLSQRCSFEKCAKVLRIPDEKLKQNYS